MDAPTPIAWVTPPAPTGDQGILEFSPACDTAMIRSARREAPLKDSIFACRSALEWAGAAHRYPAALNGRDEENAFATLADLCFKASGEEYERSGACQDVVGRD